MRRVFLSALLLFLFIDQIVSQDDEILKIETDLVILNVVVEDKQGNYIHNLKMTDFKILEEGKEQKISTFGEEETPFAAAVLIDMSGSMESRVSLARSAAIRFLDGLRDSDVAAVYKFDSKVELLQPFGPGRDLVDTAYGIKAEGFTVLHDSIVEASRALATREEKRRAILVLSDGADTRSSASLDSALRTASTSNVTIYTVDMSQGSGRNSAAAALRTMASRTGGRYIGTPGGKGLRDAFASVVNELGNIYTIGFTPQNRTRDGRWRKLELKLASAGLTARTRQGYFAPKS
jgi:Ca-activated chloride channel homolog